MPDLRLQKRRVLSPDKLKRARLAAQMTNVAEVARKIDIDRAAYLRWESSNPRGDRERRPLTHLDYISLTNALALFGVSYEDVTDPVVDEDLVSPPSSVLSAPA